MTQSGHRDSFAERDVMEYPAPLHCLDVGGPDHLAPLIGFVSDQLPKVSRRARKHRTTQVAKSRFQLRIGKARIDLSVELVDDLGGRAHWRAHAVPRAHIVAWYKLAHAWNVR